MKNFSVQSFALTVIIAMIYAAHIQHDTPDPVHLIYHLADLMLKEEKWDIQVPQARGDVTTCVREFFCNAEKALESLLKENMTDKARNHTVKLIRQLKQYNETNITNCNPDVNKTYQAKRLLCDIQGCATGKCDKEKCAEEKCAKHGEKQ